MKIVGLLTPAEARKIGPDRLWLFYLVCPEEYGVIPVKWSREEKLWITREGKWIEDREGYGLAPPPGLFLPAEAAKKEHGARALIAYHEIGETKIRAGTWHASADAWVLDGHGLCYPRMAIGWAPIVHQEEDL